MSKLTAAVTDTTGAIRTKRLVLRPWRDSDREAFAALNADPAVREHFPGLMTREDSDGFVDRIEAHWDTDGWGLWAVEVREHGQFIGFVGLSEPSFEAHFTPCTEIGWRLARSSWGRGYATEAARACLDFAFRSLGLPEVVAFTVPANARSRAVMERLGMRHDAAGDFDHPRLPAGHPLQRHVLYRLRREDWQPGSTVLAQP